MEEIIELLHKVGRLKELERTGWVLRKVPNPESVADHSFRLSIMALLLSDEFDLDKNKCIQMALIHDLAESITGDITPHEDMDKAEKYETEKNTIISLFKGIKAGNLIELWKEYEKCESQEAKFVNELDKLEMLIQSFEYKQKYKDLDLSEFLPYVEERIKNPYLIKIIEILKRKDV